VNRHLFAAAALALCLCPNRSPAAGKQPPAEYADYVAAVR
jgi:hypothetical protein